MRPSCLLIVYRAVVFGLVLTACVAWSQAQAQDSVAPSSHGSSESSPTTLIHRLANDKVPDAV